MTQTINKTRKQTEIQAAAISRVNHKVTGQCLGYLVPSDQEGVDPYKVTFNYEAHRYECNCKCGEESKHTHECKHIRAVKQICAIRAESQKQQAPTHEVEGTLPQETRQRIMNWHQSQAGDAMEREYTAPKYNFNSLGYPTSGYRKLDSNA